MNDLEICKRIAEIEGFTVSKCGHTKDGVWCSMYENNCYGHYNPLTDDALCFRLMIKYKLSLIAPEGDQVNWDCAIREVLTVDKSPNHAICLAIIAAHEEE